MASAWRVALLILICMVSTVPALEGLTPADRTTPLALPGSADLQTAVGKPAGTGSGRGADASNPALAVSEVSSAEAGSRSGAGWASFPEGRVRLARLPRGVEGFGGVLEFDLAPEWHVYWIHAGDAGYPPTLRTRRGVDAPLAFPLPRRWDIGGGVISIGYEHRPAFPVVTSAEDLKDGAQVDFLVCREQCLPRKVDLRLDGVFGAAAFDSLLLSVPLKATLARLEYVGNGERGEIWIALPGRAHALGADLYIAPKGAWLPGHPAIRRVAGDTLWLGLPVAGAGSELPDTLRFTVVVGPLDGQRPLEDSPILATTDLRSTRPGGPLVGSGARTTGIGLLVALGFGLLGGLLLNLMPCVLPVLAIKATALTELRKHGTGRARAAGWATTAGILFGMMILAAAVIALRQAGSASGWGAPFQQPVFVAALTLLMAAFALNLLGVFEFRTPRLVLALGARRLPEGLLEDFAQGLLATALATPCTAPFLGTAVGFAIGQSPATILAVFAAIGIGLGLPYIAMALFPSSVAFLPRPGAWMEVLRRVLALPVAATAAWLYWVLSGQIDRSLQLVFLWSLVLGGALWALLGFFQRRGERGREALTGAVIALVALAILGGLLGAGRDAGLPGRSPAGLGAIADWRPFTEARFDSLRAVGVPVLVDGTADWCVTCKFNRVRVLEHGDVARAMGERGVVVLVADWTRRDDAFGKFLEKHGRQGVPFYLFSVPGAEPVVWPELLGRSFVLAEIGRLPRR